MDCLSGISSKCIRQIKSDDPYYFIADIRGYGKVYVKEDHEYGYGVVAFDPQLYDGYYHNLTIRDCHLSVWNTFGRSNPLFSRGDYSPDVVAYMLKNYPITLEGQLRDFNIRDIEGYGRVLVNQKDEIVFDPQTYC